MLVKNKEKFAFCIIELIGRNLFPLVIIILHPAAKAILAAFIFVFIPPTAIEEEVFSAFFSTDLVIFFIYFISKASVFFLGLDVYNPSTSDKIINKFELVI